MRSRQIGRRIPWRESLVRRLRFPRWRRKAGPYIAGKEGRMRWIAPRLGRVHKWIGGPLLKTWLRLHRVPDFVRLPVKELG